MPYLSLTTWSLHRNLGPLRWTEWDEAQQTQVTRIQDQPETIQLLNLPHELAKQGFKSIEVCHFNFPSTDETYLKELREAFSSSGIIFHCLLVDYGDISHADAVRRASDIEYIKKWIDIASTVGAERVRVVAGDAPPEDSAALLRSQEGLNELVEYAKSKNVRIVTENFRPLATTKANCLELLEGTHGEMGITVDFGNFLLNEKYDAIQALMPNAESVHAKAYYNGEGQIDAEEYRRSLDLVAESGYSGPITLVYDGPGNLWDGIDRLKTVVKEYCL